MNVITFGGRGGAMRDTVASIEGEFLRYRKLGEGAFGQVSDADLGRAAAGNGNSMATLIQHISGNFLSRFTDFLTTDGEKPWRDRESEFAARTAAREDLRASWESGWKALEGALESLTDADLGRTVTIRGQELSVREALHRSLAHASYHVGQMVMLGRSISGDKWRFLTIPPGMSAEYNRAPSLEKFPAPAAGIADDIAARIVKAVTGPVWHGPALAEVLSDVGASWAAAGPAAGAHSIGELVLHVSFWCDDSLSRVGATGTLPEPGEGVDWPAVPDPLDEQRWRELVDGMAQSHRALAAATRLLSPDRLGARVPGRRVTYEDMLRGVVEHAAYHGGQIAILRRSLRGGARL
jgi:uncharacterized damage-inducible protein DinB